MQVLETNVVIKNPYPGLRSFGTNEQDLFFGRERQLDELLRKIRSNRFLAVVGTSGSGKSSLIKASLVPRLKEGFAGQAGSNWRIAVCNPANNPIGNLSRQLAQRNVLHSDEMMDPDYPAKIKEQLEMGSLGIVEAFKQSAVKRGENLLIVVDQFEEIFRHSKQSNRKHEEAAAFVNLLLNASRQKEVPIYIVLTMRSSFIGSCTEFRGLPEAINDGQFLIPRMKTEDLKRAIINPIEDKDANKATGVATTIDRELVKRIIEDLGEDFDELATLQHLLVRMWNNWADAQADLENPVPITIDNYRAVGTIKGALAKHAEEAYSDLKEEKGHYAICERLFRALAEKGPDGKAVGRPVLMKEVMGVAQKSLKDVRFVVAQFSREDRLFLNAPPAAEIDEDSVISIGHESLMQRWDRLKMWSDDETECSETYMRLCTAAALELEGKGGLWKDPELSIGLKWYDPAKYDPENDWKLAPNKDWAKRYNYGTTYNEAEDFLLRSEEEQTRLLNRDKEAEDKKEKKNKGLMWFGVLFGTVCLALALWAINSANRARISERSARKNAQAAQRATYLAELNKQEANYQSFLAELSTAKAEAEKKQAESATLSAMESDKLARKKAKEADQSAFFARNALEEARRKEQEALQQKLLADAATDKAKRETDKANKARDLALQVKGLSLAQSVAVKSWKVEDEDVQGLLAKEAYELNSINGGKPQDAYIYEAVYKAIDKLQEKSKNNPHFNALNQVPSGVERVGRVRAIKISPDNTKIYSTGSEGYLLDWAFRTYESQKERDSKENRPTILSKGRDVSRSLDISPDGKYLASAGDGGSIQLFDIAKSEVRTDVVFNPHKGKRVWSLMFLPNGNGLISSGDDGRGKTSIQYTNMNGESTPLVEQTEFRVTSMDISANGKYIAGAGKSSQVWIWNIQKGKREFVLEDPRSNMHATSVAINPQGRFVAVGYRDGTLMIWDMEKFKGNSSYIPEERLRNHSAAIADLEFSKDGKMLIAGSLDKTATLWTIRDEAQAGETEYKEFPYKDPKFQPIKFENHDDWVTSVAFSNDGSKVVTGCNNGVMKIWEVDMTLYADQICEIVRQNLSNKNWRKYIGTDDSGGEELYILTSDNGRRIPLSTCGFSVPQMSDSK